MQLPDRPRLGQKAFSGHGVMRRQAVVSQSARRSQMLPFFANAFLPSRHRKRVARRIIGHAS